MTSFDTGQFLCGLALSAGAVVVALAITLVVALRAHRHGVIDVTWGLGFVVVAAVTFVVALPQPDGLVRRLAVLGLTAVWGLRLALHIGLRSRGHGEDPRYEELLGRARRSRTAYAVRHVYLPQGLVLLVVSLPVQMVMAQTDGPGWLAVAGLAIGTVGVALESVADRQLGRFRAAAASGEVLDTGLWRYSRHPNYFGDACVWWGLFVVALLPWPGVICVISPALMTWLLARGTGKPLLEARMHHTRPAYADYVRRTSGFVPLPPRRA